MIYEQRIIDKIAEYERSIEGIRNSYGFAQNPDNLVEGMAPAVLHWPMGFTSEPTAHYNRWGNEIRIKSSLFVVPRQSRGGNLRFLENAAMPFLGHWRNKFQSEAVIKDIMSATGGQRVWLTDGVYGAGGPFLTINGVEWVGIHFTFNFKETN